MIVLALKPEAIVIICARQAVMKQKRNITFNIKYTVNVSNVEYIVKVIVKTSNIIDYRRLEGFSSKAFLYPLSELTSSIVLLCVAPRVV